MVSDGTECDADAPLGAEPDDGRVAAILLFDDETVVAIEHGESLITPQNQLVLYRSPSDRVEQHVVFSKGSEFVGK